MRNLFWSVTILFVLAACSDAKPEASYPSNRTLDKTYESGSLLENEGFSFFGRGNDSNSGGGVGLGVNAYLWRASLDTISFMPIASADPFGGVIITDWYNPPENSGERIKLNILILGRELRVDGVKVRVFRQARSTSGEFVDVAATSETATAIENAILTRARELRVASKPQKD